MIDYSTGSGNGRVEQRLARASPGESLANAWHAFRIWRRTRPFWGGLLVIVGASEILLSEQAPLPVITRLGMQGLAGYLTPTFMLLCGVLLWLISMARIYHSLLAILLALDSWITSNLGGFLIGMLIGVVGGALAFAWTTDADYASYGWLRGKPRIGLPAWALDLISRLKERAATQSEGLGPRIGVRLARPHRAGAKAAAAGTELVRKIIASVRGPVVGAVKAGKEPGTTRDTDNPRSRVTRSISQSLTRGIARWSPDRRLSSGGRPGTGGGQIALAVFTGGMAVATWAGRTVSSWAATVSGRAATQRKRGLTRRQWGRLPVPTALLRLAGARYRDRQSRSTGSSATFRVIRHRPSFQSEPSAGSTSCPAAGVGSASVESAGPDGDN